jgi:hypothetical protein
MFLRIQTQYPVYTSPHLPTYQLGNKLRMRLCKEARSSHTRSQRRTRVPSDKPNKVNKVFRRDMLRGNMDSNLHTRHSSTGRTNILRVGRLHSQAPMTSLRRICMPKAKCSSRDSTARMHRRITVSQPSQPCSLLLRTSTLSKISLPTRSPISNSNSNKVSGSRLLRPSKATRSSRLTHRLRTAHSSRRGNQDINSKGRWLDRNMPK